MTEVLSIPAQLNNSSLFGTHPLRRSSSQTSFLLQSPTTYPTSPSSTKTRYANTRRENRPSTSLPSSAPSSPRLPSTLSSQPSYASTPSSSLSLDQQYKADEEDIVFPSYDNEYTLKEIQVLVSELEQPPSLRLINSRNITPSASDNSLHSRPFRDTSGFRAKAGDDTALKAEPTKHVDYLSYNWNEEDVWATWRHIVARRKVYPNACRLENASWRSWTKCKYRLGTIFPEKLNWMKDHDVTWLYGPLQTGSIKYLEFDSAPRTSQLSRCDSFISKKPILKKRTLSELMLQRSLSSSTLMKQATDAIRAQQPEKNVNDRSVINDQALPNFVKPSNRELPCLKLTTALPAIVPSVSTSGSQTPSIKRHIHFNNEVEQCIAINKCSVHDNYYRAIPEDSSSEEDVLMMKPVHNNRAKLGNRSTPRSSFSSENKTIAMLPSTTLNYRGDTPDSSEKWSKHNGSTWHIPFKPSLSYSQETLKPTMPSINSPSKLKGSPKSTASSINFLLDDEDEEMDMNWEPLAGKRESLYAHEHKDSKFDPNNEQNIGLHETSSGMFMPYEGNDVTAGIYDKLYSTVNTAKDIAHVIWNVGWRK